MSACAVTHTSNIARIALLAPFEGRYREIGYNALYAARLALADTGDPQVELLPIDAGGDQAANRARAFTFDPQIKVVILLGYDSTTPQTLQALGDLPALVVGGWGATPDGDHVFILSNPQIDAAQVSVTAAAQMPAPVTGGDVFALIGFAKLRSSLTGVTVLSSGSLPTADFAARYGGGDPFAPAPGLLATLTYDAARIAVQAAESAAPRDFIAAVDYSGLNGVIRFKDGYWQDAPIHHYQYVNGQLTTDSVSR